MQFWPQRRADELNALFQRLAGLNEIYYSFVPSPDTDFLGYFPKDIELELDRVSQGRLRRVPLAGEHGAQADIVVLTAHGPNRASEIWELRERLKPGAIVAVWLWDNHLGPQFNLQVTLACDVAFPSHWDDADYLYNPATLVGSHVPACSAQWSAASAERLMAETGFGERLHKVLANYVEYHFASRTAILKTLSKEIGEVEVLMMPAGDRTRYFSMSSADRFAEWTAYKAALILPVTSDLSTRVFDALLAGMIPVVPTSIVDFDTVLPPAIQGSLGIVRFDSLDIEAIRHASCRALEIFDAMGAEGVQRRHRYAIEHHMLANRIRLMLDNLLFLASGELTVEFGDGPHGPALYQTSRLATAETMVSD